jgi:GT2 family glycosyltransferase
MLTGPNTTAGTSQQSWDLLKKTKDKKWDKMPNLASRRYRNDNDKVKALEKIFKNKFFDVNTLAFFSVLMRREIFDKVGLLSEDYDEGYFDDSDFCRRVKDHKENFKLVYVPSAYIHHFNKTTFSNVFTAKEYKDIWKRNEKIYNERFQK